jgi:hypothetical protein
MTLALMLGLASVSGASAQQGPATSQMVGEIARCSGSDEAPAANVAVGSDGGARNLARTDAGGQFSISLAPGQYMVVATADDGSTASRPYVPVTAGEELDIGILDLGAGPAGCGFASSDGVSAPVVATATVTPTTPPLLPTITPTPLPTATAAPADDQSSPDTGPPPPDDSSSDS